MRFGISSGLEDASVDIAPPGFARSLDYPEVPVGAILLGTARRWPDKVGWIDPDAGRELTFGECARRAARFANALRARGVGVGDVVAVHAPNCIEYPAVYYGILLAGAALSPPTPLPPPRPSRRPPRCCLRTTWPFSSETAPPRSSSRGASRQVRSRQCVTASPPSSSSASRRRTL